MEKQQLTGGTINWRQEIQQAAASVVERCDMGRFSDYKS